MHPLSRSRVRSSSAMLLSRWARMAVLIAVQSRAVGVRRAKEVILTGLPFGAEEAAAWGLVNRVTEGG